MGPMGLLEILMTWLEYLEVVVGEQLQLLLLERFKLDLDRIQEDLVEFQLLIVVYAVWGQLLDDIQGIDSSIFQKQEIQWDL